jgi:poly-beta-1,6-N-acetyl-D-glucosamine synthase
MKILDILAYFIFLYPCYMSFVWMTGGLLFSIRREGKQSFKIDSHPLFSIIIAAYNEGDIIALIVENLKDLNYPKYEVIVVNDGSKDNTRKILDKLVIKYQSWLKVVHLEQNSGKAKALNIGILLSKGQFLVTIDADCILDKDAINWFAWHFMTYPRVGAVTGNPRVWNRTSLLGKIQAGEYSSIIGLIKRTQRIVGKILTVSGVIAAYRKSAILNVGLFDSDTITEDIDITWKLQEQFWDVRYEPRALCRILVPETLKGLWRQRLRWAQGGLEVLIKHASIWSDVRFRRFWPIYIDYALGAIWALAISLVTITWLVVVAVKFICHFSFVQTYCTPFYTVVKSISILSNPLYPRWYGAVLCLICLMTFFVSFVIDQKYEKGIMKYYFWVVWYPLVYWVIIAITTIKAIYNVVIKRKRSSTWKSPDRGLHTLKSSTKRDLGLGKGFSPKP